MRKAGRWGNRRLQKRDNSGSISDTGQGIPLEVRDRIFQPVFTTRAHGTGLGLSLAQHIVEDHSGRISFESEVDHGTTFIIELPAMNPAPRAENET
jgi:signal transduction histidine kinase